MFSQTQDNTPVWPLPSFEASATWPSLQYHLESRQARIMFFLSLICLSLPYKLHGNNDFRFCQLLKSHIGGLSFTLVDRAQSNLQSGKFTEEKTMRRSKSSRQKISDIMKHACLSVELWSDVTFRVIDLTYLCSKWQSTENSISIQCIVNCNDAF